MRQVLIALFALVLFCGCAPISGDITVSRYPQPEPWYVYTYADGSCWADDVWYPACPWHAGPRYGYYYRYGGAYYWEPHIIWGYRVQPPPWQWRRHYHHHHRHHIVVPPRGRRR